MDQIADSQDLARRFNEDDAVWLRYEHIRRLRLSLGVQSLLPSDVLDAIDWIAWSVECRERWCVGRTNKREL